MTSPLRFPNAAASAEENPLLRVRSFTSGFGDGLGDRQIALDGAGVAFLEVLRIKPEFADVPAFERALHDRVEAVRHLHHPSIAVVHTAGRLDAQGLSLVSNYAPGRRLSELATTDHGPALALDLIRGITPALATLHWSGVAHGALSTERIVVGDGGFMLVEHVLGPAIEALELSRAQLNALGLVVPAGIGPVRFDARTDMMQFGFIVLSLLLGRRLDAADYPARVPALIDEFVEGAGSPRLFSTMRVWLERAMQIDPRPFASARDAHDAFDELPNDIEVARAESARALLAFPSELPATPPPMAIPPLPLPSESRTQAVSVKPVESATVRTTSPPVAIPPSRLRRSGRWVAWIAGVFCLLAAGEGIAIFFLASGRPSVDVIEVRSPANLTAGAPASIPAPPPIQAPSENPVDPSGRAAVPAPTKPATTAPVVSGPPSSAAGPRFGGLTLSSAIDLQVFMDGKLIGSTAGPMAVNEGSHNFEFVNEELGFRLSRNMDVKNAQMASVNVPVPNGRVSINATPWAEVTIDGAPAGETPLANFAVPIGKHEVVFRHPQLGERKQTIVVKVGVLLRVIQAFQDAVPALTRGER